MGPRGTVLRSLETMFSDLASSSPQISRFLWDHGDVAFAPLGKLMLENFKLEGAGVSGP